MDRTHRSGCIGQVKTVCVYWNPRSGRAKQIDALREALNRDYQADWIELDEELDLPKDLQRQAAKGIQSVVAAGGDGTINAVVNGLMNVEPDQRPALGIIPIGTANDFAVNLQIPNDPIEAAKRLSTPARPVDIVEICGKDLKLHYANVAAGGNCVRVSESMTEEIKQTWGAFSYLRGAIHVLADMATYKVTATCDDEVIEDLTTWAILVANGRTNAGHIEVAPRASVADGLIDVIMVRDGTVADMLEIAAANLLGDFLKHDQIIFRQVKQLTLHSDPPMRFTIDGEVIDKEPVQFRVLAGAIQMHGAAEAARKDSAA